jgi:hypothetical protein
MIELFEEWDKWRVAKAFFIGLVLATAAFFLYVWRLGTLVPGLSAREISAIKGSSSFDNIKNNPINLPHKLPQFVFQHFGHHGAFWMRSVSVFFALLFLAALFLQLKKWFGIYIASLGTLLAASSPWFILAARNATPDVMFFVPFLVVWAYSFFTRTEEFQTSAWFSLIAALAIALYVPGMIWFLLIGVIFGARKFFDAFIELDNLLIAAGIVILLLAILPLGYGLYMHQSIIKNWLLIPSSFPAAADLGKNLVWSLSTLVFRSRQHLDYSLGRLGLISIIQSVLALVGIYALARSARRELATMVGLLIIGVVFSVLNNNFYLLLICLPALAVFDAAALRFLYVRWMKVFPLNPVPRTLAIIFVCLLVLLQVTYGIRYSLAAWPHNLEIRKSYMLK